MSVAVWNLTTRWENYTHCTFKVKNYLREYAWCKQLIYLKFGRCCNLQNKITQHIIWTTFVFVFYVVLTEVPVAIFSVQLDFLYLNKNFACQCLRWFQCQKWQHEFSLIPTQETRRRQTFTVVPDSKFSGLQNKHLYVSYSDLIKDEPSDIPLLVNVSFIFLKAMVERSCERKWAWLLFRLPSWYKERPPCKPMKFSMYLFHILIHGIIQNPFIVI